MRHWILGLIVLLAAAGGSVGCTSAAPYRMELEAYAASYLERTGAHEHRVARGEHTLAAREYGREYGREHAGNGPSLVLLHGFPDSQHLYDLLVPELARERHVITFDFLGWGDSDKPREHVYDFRSLDDDLAAVLDHFDPASVVLVAHDISGPAAVDRAAIDARVEALVLLNTVIHRTSHVVRPEAIESFSASGVLRDLKVWGARTFDAVWLDRHQEQLRKFVVRSDEETTRLLRALGGQSLDIRPAFFELNSHLRAEMAARAERLDHVRSLETPVALIFGTEDPYLNVDVARELEDLFPRSQLLFLEEAGHYVQVDRPVALAAAIDGVLRDAAR